MRACAVLAAAVLTLTASAPWSAAADENRLLDIMRGELVREMAGLQAQETPPYYMAFTLTDVHFMSVSASFGALTASDEDRSRLLSVDVRVGDYELDNTHELRDRFDYSSSGYVFAPRDDGEDALRTLLWQETNRRYREAVDRFVKVKTNVAIKVAEEDSSADFSRIPDPPVYTEKPLDIETILARRKSWEEKVRKYSAVFLENDRIYGGRASMTFRCDRKYYVTSEGARIARNAAYARLSVSGFIKSDDGMELPLYKTYFAFAPDGLPPDETVLADVRKMIGELTALREAPVVEPYTGPAILSGRAAGVFFHEILGHRVEGHRQKSESEGQTFKKHVGEKILPESLQITFDPTMESYGGEPLMGSYRFDDEGIRAQRVTIVENGVLRGFLMSRSPIENFPVSNGHGRAQAGRRPVSRQSNMIVETTNPLPDAELRKRLIELCREQGRPFGLLFQDIAGGFTFTGRTIPNVFNLQPTIVYKVYTDGRPDELVRGVDLVGTPLVMFSMIAAAGETNDIFHGLCGAESGSIPVSAVSPSILVNQVEVQKKTKSQELPPILPRPDADHNL